MRTGLKSSCITTNRRHLIRERFSDRAGLASGQADDEIHAADTMKKTVRRPLWHDHHLYDCPRVPYNCGDWQINEVSGLIRTYCTRRLYNGRCCTTAFSRTAYSSSTGQTTKNEQESEARMMVRLGSIHTDCCPSWFRYSIQQSGSG